MKSLSKILLSLALLLASSTPWAQATLQNAAAPTSVADFDENTWAKLLESGPRPAAYLFTTSYCSTCPDAFAKVKAGATAHKGQTVPLTVVMMDVGGNQALRHAMHFQGVTQMYSFEGFEPAIRQSVDPQWPNVTPYVVLIDKKGRLQKFIGPPTPKTLRAWLG
jgi:hypothetical protein